MSVTLSAGHGVFTNSVTGMTLGSTFTISGLPADLTTTLANLRYTPNADWNGTDSISVHVMQMTGTMPTANSNVGVNITPVNDPPTIWVGTMPSATAGDVVNLGNVFRVYDVDGDTLTLRLEAKDSNGNYVDALNIGNVPPGVTFTPNSNAIVTVTGTPGSMNIALASLTESLPNTFTGTFSLSASVSDGIAATVSPAGPASMVVNAPVTTPAEPPATTTTPIDIVTSPLSMAAAQLFKQHCLVQHLFFELEHFQLLFFVYYLD